MTRCYAYTRVSTVKQGERGVSLQEQRTAIESYAARHGIQVVDFFEERLTAAKRGRPLFTSMLRRLRQGEAQGVIIHKIDRGARNLRDWAELGELIDAGVAVHFANESVDLFSRGGRLSADIQAVVAADYVRNLREETLKGIHGRLKQGVYPFAAPLGYLNTGGGNTKAIDPDRAPLVRQVFELYASGRFSLDTLVLEMRRRGLQLRGGGPVDRNGISRILNNPFYAGILRLRSTGELFAGKHTPLITMAHFQRVRSRLQGRFRSAAWKHEFVFRGLFRCELCSKHLIGERQKGHVYYRCHTSDCPTKGFREECLERAMLDSWGSVALCDGEKAQLAQDIERLQSLDCGDEQDRLATLQARLGKIKERRARLVDALVDGVIGKSVFDERNHQLLEEERQAQDAIQHDRSNHGRDADVLASVLELASRPQQSYRLGDVAARRELALMLCSNRSVSGKQVFVEPCFPLQVLRLRHESEQCAHSCYATRTSWARIAWRLYAWSPRFAKYQSLKVVVRKQPPNLSVLNNARTETTRPALQSAGPRRN